MVSSERGDDWKKVEKALTAKETELTDKLPVADKRTHEALKKVEGRFRWPDN
jgi:hypothetical protein